VKVLREAPVLSDGGPDDLIASICAALSLDGESRYHTEGNLRCYSHVQLRAIARAMSDADFKRPPGAVFQRALSEVGPPPGADLGTAA
jgi:hypothetical protein